MRLALIGRGRMATAVGRLAAERGHAIALTLGAGDNRDGEGITRERMAGIDAALEFTRPEAAPRNLRRLAMLGIPTVSGTTGWYEHLPEISTLFLQHRAPLLYAPNFSPGVQLYLRAARQLAATMAGRATFDAVVSEHHHGAKQDAPSGTGLALAAALRAGDAQRTYPISSIRGGHEPGTHTVLFDSPHESIRLEHVARSRDAFAAGAIAAAEWLPGRTGVFTFAQMLFGEEDA
ncbi:MAG TPA: dihydrodipicolinate reductase C-terminal domain-containing protein [Gemmatimonadales bacterium]|nr:dihydrodipicolinate reductase C-terminal domain-containing protein [Gemmatimonadales bacterium]